MKMVFYLSMLIMAWACKKPEPLSPTPPGTNGKDTSLLQMVWKVPMAPDERQSQGRQPLMYKGDLICNSAPSMNGFSIWRLDGKSGEKKWSWNDFGGTPSIPYNNHQLIYEDKYAVNNNYETNVIDFETGNLSWQYLVPNKNGHPGITEVDGYIYHKHTSTSWPASKVYLVRSPFNNVRWDTIFTLYADSIDGYSPFIHGPTLWMSPSNDSILVIQNRSWKFGSNQDGQIDLYGYNLSKKKVEFVMEDIEPTGNSNVLPPVIEDNRVYVLGNRNLHCIDLVKREFIWQKGFPGSGHHLMLSNLIIDGNRLIVKPDNDAIYAFDKYTGDLLWHTFEAGHSPSHMQFYNGMVFYTAEGDGKLFAVRTANGQIVWEEDSPHDGDRKYTSAAFQNGVAINEELGYIYVHDEYFMMCFKLPE
ncbi:PQQ enzyme repeat-containing protein [Owenweeksia hongkongensis DSM 17368]|uniref:PQQ enzyme repeat-containing protein n=1 Tax=Owenweeksia hongkongensis (strain DSM 17368 / CIP 108786 / JCM 12287 / NRRL B-23963 / UST20020801) TaxID=926562 RepID=G8R2W2_OWEHD|nr:PQQ-binding-like beta-propeller repeat protein [Owenweeksia hongkongensis]AEV32956.1 PQQ enzyme repeat-containing protein [Owenweeksia hongkongensis DSM 17368]